MYPAKTNELNRQLSKVLLAIGAPGTVEKTMALLESAKDDNTDQIRSRNPLTSFSAIPSTGLISPPPFLMFRLRSKHFMRLH
jgi:hypothetical protein